MERVLAADVGPDVGDTVVGDLEEEACWVSVSEGL